MGSGSRQEWFRQKHQTLIKIKACAFPTMMMSNLPWELVEEILSRVPARSLKRLRSTCKPWNALFSDRRFTEKHFRTAAKESLVLMLKDFRFRPMSVNLNGPDPSVEFKSGLGLIKDPSPKSEQVDICQVSHCDGLLLCCTKDYRIVVSNPCLGEARWIPLETNDKRFSKFALGYSKSRHSYKILWFREPYEPNDHVAGFKIYEFSSNSWRVDDVALHCLRKLYCGVSLKGNTYWLTWDHHTSNTSLLCFDFTTERFIPMGLPKFQDSGYTSLSVVREEQLSVVHHIVTKSKMEIWVTSKGDIDTEVGLVWSKSFTVVSHLHADYYLTTPAGYLIDEEKKVVLCYNFSCKSSGSIFYIIGDDRKYRKMIPYEEEASNDSWQRPFIFKYVPSLVQITKQETID